MSGMKEYAERVAERVRHPSAALDDIALALGGEVRGRAVVMPSPGMPTDDRSMVIYFNVANLASFYIYGVDGSLSQARRHVLAKLKLVEAPVKDASERTAKAMAIWRATTPAAGTLVETYLRSRAITTAVPDRLHYHRGLWHGPSKREWPAMVALVTDLADKPVAVHRTWLLLSGKGKAPVDPQRMALGPIAGNAIRLSPVGEELFVAEGIETAMSAMVAGKVAWSAISAMGLRALILPNEVRRVNVMVDRDDDGTCERAANEAGGRWLREGRQVMLHRAPPGMDFNDVLMGEAL